MATNLTPLPPIPPPQEPVFNLKTGETSSAWYLWFKRLDEHLRDVERRITDLEP